METQLLSPSLLPALWFPRDLDARAKNESYRATFRLPGDERLDGHTSCTLWTPFSKLHIPGQMFISTNYICFASKEEDACHLIIPLREVSTGAPARHSVMGAWQASGEKAPAQYQAPQEWALVCWESSPWNIWKLQEGPAPSWSMSREYASIPLPGLRLDFGRALLWMSLEDADPAAVLPCHSQRPPHCPSPTPALTVAQAQAVSSEVSTHLSGWRSSLTCQR